MLPSSWQYFDFEELASTNDEAERLAFLYNKPLIVTACRQTSGRGRRGHQWCSLAGNLFVSFAFDGQGLSAGQWSVLSGVAVMQTVCHFCPNACVQIKWPNDVLAENAKIAGILFERADNGFWVMGVGINVVANPCTLSIGYPAQCLVNLGAQVNSKSVRDVLVQKFDALSALALSESFAPVRDLFLDHAYQLGKIIEIKQEKQIIKGVLKGLDAQANLLINTSEGIQNVNYGEILYQKE